MALRERIIDSRRHRQPEHGGDRNHEPSHGDLLANNTYDQ